MRLMTLEEIKATELNILVYIDKVCRENNIEYTLAAGTLLGAIRHKGFIPWDDDIDIYLCRPAYDKLLNLLENSQNQTFKPLTYRNNSTYIYPFAKVCDTRTSLEENGVQLIKDYGVYVDIFPVDIVPNGNLYWKKLKIMKSLLCIRYCTGMPRNVFKRVIWKGLKSIMGLLKVTTFAKLMDSEARRYEKCGSAIVADSLWGYGRCEEMPTSAYQSFIDIEFEGKKFRAITTYDTHLRAVYGDYMQLPPIAKRTSNHSFKAWWKS